MSENIGTDEKNKDENCSVDARKGDETLMNPILIVLLAVACIMSLISFFLMRYDKQCAKQGKRRVPEKTLFLAAGLFGAPGGTAAMWIFRHKTKHWYFKLFFPLMLILQAAIVGYAAAMLI